MLDFRMLAKLLTLLAAVMTVNISGASQAFGLSADGAGPEHASQQPKGLPSPAGQDTDGSGEERSQTSSNEVTLAVKSARRVTAPTAVAAPRFAIEDDKRPTLTPNSRFHVSGPSRVISFCRFME